jgi:hypothetical protein
MVVMIDHVIMFRADGLSNEGSTELMEQLGRLAEVPGILGFALGKNFGDRSRGFDYCLRVTFADKAALDAYQEDPLHLDVVRYNRAVTDEHICVDFEWEPVNS